MTIMFRQPLDFYMIIISKIGFFKPCVLFYINILILGPLDQKEQNISEREINGEEIPRIKDLEGFINEKRRLPMDPRTLVPNIIL